MTAKLYCFGESGNAYKAALTMELAGFEYEQVFVDFFKGEARTDAFKAINPMGEVPVLVDGDLTLTQSGVIQQYVVDQTGKLGGTAADTYEVLRWVLWDNHKLSSQVGMTRFLMNFLPEDKRPHDVIAFMQGRLKAAYSVLDTHLAGRDWLAGDCLTVADLSCCSYLFYEEPFGFERADWPNIDAWLTRISETPGWKHPYDLMQRALPA
ncbi:glutathione S-transferase [Litoreibacter meonggei]|uniref:Glutathione S-transferase n=1 Tax=Litoreibacter meonggei TaxID=1049199 RepID=A0A497WR43_9RHOB|nr:glutathione S-transferase family protein [Litoreibacter meonggei]RLJ59281.1 glutathione S-transferase [Litoreibacter meonggei]